MDHSDKEMIIKLQKKGFKLGDIAKAMESGDSEAGAYKRGITKGKKVIVIPDTQVKPGVPLFHLPAIGNYINSVRPDTVVVIGDWWDMASLNKFGTKQELEGKRILEDIIAGQEAMDLFLSHALKDPEYKPRMVFTVGNHDPQVRIPRAISHSPELEGMLEDNMTEWLESKGFEVNPFFEPVNIEGVRFAHYFVNPHSAKKMPLSGAIDTCLKNCGFSFVQGHQQGLKLGKHYLADGTQRLGIVAGSCYLHSEEFMGIQGNKHWQGIIQLNDLKDGSADICELSLDYLIRKYY